MNKKSLCILTAAALLSGVAGTATAGSIYAASTGPESLNHFTPHVLPVLVKVNDQGEITHMSSAYKLRPKYQRMLRKTLNEMITAPAHKDGHAISSQFVINMATKVTPRKDGKYNLRFAYVSTQPVPYGSWYWNHIDGHRLALVRQGAFSNMRPIHRHYRPHYRSFYNSSNRTSQAASPAPAQRSSSGQSHRSSGHSGH